LLIDVKSSQRMKALVWPKWQSPQAERNIPHLVETTVRAGRNLGSMPNVVEDAYDEQSRGMGRRGVSRGEINISSLPP
jgi:hypothetical protein